MWNLLKSELLKLRRCQILLVGLVALALCPLVQYGSQLIVEAEYRNPNYDFSALFENVVWGNTQIFLPISLVMIGGWLIDRESTHDTLKNIMTIPVSMPKMLGAKLLLVGMLAVLLGIYSVGITLITGLTVGLSGLTAEVFFHGGTQIVLAALTTYLVCMPLILIFGQIRGAYLGGSILAFFLGYSMLFFKSGILASIYPFSAALILVGFDMSEYAGTTTSSPPLLAVIGVGIMVLWAVLLLLMSSNKKEMKSRKPGKCQGKRKACCTQERKVIAVKKIVLALTFVLVGSFMLAGCSKDEILDHYNNIVQSAGSIELTGKSSLQGEKEKGIDDYTGNYTADYANFSGTEYLFGGTSIKRESGKELSIDCTLEITEGTAKSILDFWI